MIANTFFRSGFIEAWGRGIEKIKDSCMQTGNPLPEYFVKKEDIMVIFKGLNRKNTQDDTQDDDLTDKEKRILVICKDGKSKQEIAALMGYKTIKSIKPEVEALLNKGKLRMSVPDKPKSKNQKYITTGR